MSKCLITGYHLISKCHNLCLLPTLLLRFKERFGKSIVCTNISANLDGSISRADPSTLTVTPLHIAKEYRDVIPKIDSFGGISIIAHPNKKRVYPFGACINWVKENLIGLTDGIEDVSSGHGYQENYSEKLGLAAIGSSDDHYNLLMGTAVTAYDGRLHNNIINAVKAKETKAIMVDNSLQPLIKLARYAITSYA